MFSLFSLSFHILLSIMLLLVFPSPLRLTWRCFSAACNIDLFRQLYSFSIFLVLHISCVFSKKLHPICSSYAPCLLIFGRDFHFIFYDSWEVIIKFIFLVPLILWDYRTLSLSSFLNFYFYLPPLCLLFLTSVSFFPSWGIVYSLFSSSIMFVSISLTFQLFIFLPATMLCWSVSIFKLLVSVEHQLVYF